MKKITVLLLSFITLSGFSQTLQEGFEGTTFPPTTPAPGWVVFQNAFGTRQWGSSVVAHAGLGAAQMNSRQNIAINNTSKDYLVTPLVTIPANGQLRFWARTENNGNQGTLYQVRVASGANVANQTDEAAFNVAPANLIQQWTEDEISTTYNVYEEKVVNFPAALIGTAVYIAFVNEYTQTTTTISGDTWYLDDVLLVSRCLDPTVLTANPILSTSATLGWTNPNGPTYGNPCAQWEIEIIPSTQLTPSGSGIIVNTNSYNATTLTAAPFTPLAPLTSYKYYVRSICTFSSSLWAGPFPFTTTVAPLGCNGNFVDSGGTTANYQSNENLTTTISPLNPGDLVTVTFTAFDTEVNGSGIGYDGLYVYDGLTTASPQISSGNPVGVGALTTLAGAYWGTTIPGPFTATSPNGSLTFNFKSDTSVTKTGWVANVTCAPRPSCTKPTLLVTSSITSSTVNLGWTQNANPDLTVPNNWEYLVLPCGSTTPLATTSGVTTTFNPFVITGLSPGTCYDIYVRAICSSTDSSSWSIPKSVTTKLCDNGCNYTFKVSDSFGDGWNGNTISIIQNGVTITTLTGPTAAQGTTPQNIVVSLCPGPYQVYWNAGGSFATEVGLVITSFLGDVVYSHTSGTGLQDSLIFSDVTLCAPPTCAKPKTLTVTSITQTSALVGWTQPANPDTSVASAWEIIALPCNAAMPTPTTTGWIPTTSNPFYLTGLNPGTCYNFYVRAICSATDSSLLSVPKSFNTLIVNDECVGAIEIPINQNTNCLQTVLGNLAFATASNQANSCGGAIDDDDIWFKFTATSTSHYITILGANYTSAPTNINYVLYTGTCGLLTQFGGCVTANNNIATGLTIGQTYYIRAYSTGTTAVTTTFELCIGTNVGSCPTALPLCAIQPIIIPNNVGVPSSPNPINPFSTTSTTVGCLGTAPSPTFYYLQIPTNGNYTFLLEQNTNDTFSGTGLDVDFVAWGPYDSNALACSGISTTNAPGTGNSCSYSAAFTETYTVNNARAGQIYVIMITNFSGRKGFVRITQTTGPIPSVCCPFGNFTYLSTLYCQNGANPSPIFVSNATAGTFSALPVGLSINPNTGLINLADSTPGTYIIHNAVSANGLCPSDDDSWTITITAPPANTGIAYSSSTFCKSDSTLQTVTQTGTTGGTYTVVPATGLNLNTATGAFTPSTSTIGSYVISYNLPPSGGCPGATTSANITIEAVPIATFNYNSTAYCQTGSNPVITYTGGGVAGTFSSTPAGLSLDTNTGAINLATSSLGNYTITNTITAIGTCGIISAAFNIAVTSSPLASFSYSSLTFCKNGTNPTPSLLPGASAGAFTSTTGLDINATTGEINLSASTAGLYTVTNTIIAANGCSSDTKTTQVEILANPVIVQPLPVSVCNSYLLPALTVGNYYSQSGGLGAPLDITIPITVSQTVYVYAQNANCSSEKSFIVTINTAPLPTLNVTQPTCGVQTGTLVVTSPVSVGGGIIPNNLFISEVTDESSGSLTYVEIFNGTGASVDLSNYKLKFYNNGGTTTSCNNQLTGILNNNSTFVVSVGSSPSTVITGVTPNISFAGCGGVNTNDNIRLTTNSGTEIDLWGDTTGVDFTPTNQPGYTYRRNTTAVVPSLTWNPADWTTLDPQDYSNIGSYTFSSSNYEYSLDGGTYQTSVTFNLVAAGVHTITVHDLATGCYSLPFSVTLNAVPLVPSVTSFSYPTTPICKNDTVNPIPTPVSGFTTGGTYSCLSLGASLNSASGVINLANAPSGTHIVTYTVVTNTTTCVQGGSSQFTIVINPIVTPITTINYASPVCINATTNPTQTITGITSGGTYSCITLGTSLNSTSGIIDLSNINAIAGSHTIIYSVNANPATCQVANSSNAIIVINPIVTPITVFDYATPICAIGSMSMPRPAIGFTSGGSYSSTSGLSISSSTGEIISTNSTPGNYIVTYSVSAVPATCQVSGTRTTNVVISNPVGVTITGECLGSNYSLKANAVGSSFDPTNVTYSWTDSSGLAIGTTQTITVTNPENYSVSVLSNGCTGTANLNVINTTCTVQKGISPNGDGDNESFILSDVNELSIFNRYGTKVYSHGANYTNEWHGQSNGGSELPDGTYYYVIKRGSGESVTGWIYINR